MKRAKKLQRKIQTQKNSVWIKPSDTKTYVNAYVAAETWARKSEGDRRYPKSE